MVDAQAERIEDKKALKHRTTGLVKLLFAEQIPICRRWRLLPGAPLSPTVAP
jgi:hypothetical protein